MFANTNYLTGEKQTWRLIAIYTIKITLYNLNFDTSTPIWKADQITSIRLTKQVTERKY